MFGVYAFSEEALSSDSLNQFVLLSSVSATTEVGNVSIGIGVNVVLDDAAATATTQVGDIVISISTRFDVSGVFATGEVGDVQVYGLVVPGIDEFYIPEVPDSDSNYQRVAPAPAREWNDLVT